MQLCEIEIPVFANPDYDIYLTSVFELSFYLINPVNGMFYLTYCFIGMKLLVLYHMHKIYYCLYVLDYCKVIFD